MLLWVCNSCSAKTRYIKFWQQFSRLMLLSNLLLPKKSSSSFAGDSICWRFSQIFDCCVRFHFSKHIFIAVRKLCKPEHRKVIMCFRSPISYGDAMTLSFTYCGTVYHRFVCTSQSTIFFRDYLLGLPSLLSSHMHPNITWWYFGRLTSPLRNTYFYMVEVLKTWCTVQISRRRRYCCCH